MNMSYNRIKSNFKYGKLLSAASEQDIEDLKMMLHYYPREEARSLFNADYMLSYPYNMAGMVCKENLTRARGVVIGKDGMDIFLYFIMSDTGIKDFDQYLTDFKGTFWFKDK